MKNYRRTSKIVGILFLVAMAASLFGGTLVSTVLSSPDYFTAVTGNRTQLLMGALLELTNGMAVVGIGALMFTILKKQSESVARVYLGFRLVEAVFCSAIIIAPLALLQLSAGASSEQGTQAAGSMLVTARAAVNNLIIPVMFCLGAALFYSLLYRSKLLPRFIPVWGIAAVILLFAVNIVGLFRGSEMDTGLQMALGLPIIMNEVFLGIWLIVKGFKKDSPVVAPIKTAEQFA